jgi:hypothetical protein
MSTSSPQPTASASQQRSASGGGGSDPCCPLRSASQTVDISPTSPRDVSPERTSGQCSPPYPTLASVKRLQPSTRSSTASAQPSNLCRGGSASGRLKSTCSPERGPVRPKRAASSRHRSAIGWKSPVSSTKPVTTYFLPDVRYALLTLRLTGKFTYEESRA